MANKKQTKKVEIVRSFAYKVNLGNYQMADFFCSEKSEVSEKDAEKTSEALYQFCKNEAIKSANQYLKEIGKQPEVFNLKKEIIAELKKWFKEGGDKVSDYGKENPQTNYNEKSKMADIKQETAEAEKLPVVNLE